MSESDKLSRQQLYDKIRESSKDEYILKEMQRLGFWPSSNDTPSLSEELIEQRAKLQSRFTQLANEKHLLDNPELALKALHKQRKKEALKQREENKRARNQVRFDRAMRWHKTQSQLITYLGERFSLGLHAVTSNTAQLEQQKIPALQTSGELAEAMGISIQELRFLSYSKDVSKISHYQRFQMQKKSGGTRFISAPMPRLKRAQYWVLSNILEPLALHDSAHGFVAGRSIVSNAKMHVGKDVVINIDLQDFFPSISYPRVKGLFEKLGYSEHLASVLGLLCTEPDSQEIELDGQRWHVSNGQRKLPQGAPTSPNISNLICRKLDRRLANLAKKRGFDYSRYADDMSFSAQGKTDSDTTKLLWAIRTIIADEGFHIHPKKTQIMRKHTQQEVTGVVVNKKLSVDRKTLKRFRALLFQIDKDGPQGKTWSSLAPVNSSKNQQDTSDADTQQHGTQGLFPSIEGYANFVAMVDAEKGIALQKQVVDLKRKYGISVKNGKVQALNKKLFKIKASKGEKPREHWWSAQVPPVPTKELTQQEIDEQKAKQKQQAKQESSQTSDTQASSVDAPSSEDKKSSEALLKINYNWLIWFLILLLTIYILNRK